jgi:hypothetical protein
MMARLEVIEPAGGRLVTIKGAVTTLGRGTECDVRLSGTDVSRDHAEIVRDGERYMIRDRGSRFGTFVNGEPVSGVRELNHGDTLRLGQGNDCQAIFRLESGSTASVPRPGPGVGDLRQVATLLEALRALGSGRVLDEVLAMVIDSAIDLASAERGFIMLAGSDNRFEFKMGRGRGRVTLPG